MRNRFFGKHMIWLIIVTLALLIGMATFGGRAKLTFLESATGVVLSPFQKLFTSVGKGVGGFFGHFADIETLKQTNAELTQKLDATAEENRKLEEFKLENERLKGLLELKDEEQERQYVAAKVSGWDGNNWYDSFTINKGSTSGLAVNQPVVTGKGVIGHVTEVAGHWARVTTIIDPASSVGATVKRTGVIAMMDGDLDLAGQGLCKLTYLTKGADLMIGDIIETSGRGGIYPPGLLLGKIRELRPETKGVSQYAVIETAADFNHISEVLVIIN